MYDSHFATAAFYKGKIFFLAGLLLLLNGVFHAGALADTRNYLVDENGVFLKGYDLVSYYDSTEPIEGNRRYEIEINEITYRFANSSNAAKFIADPKRYLPQFNGYCAFGVALGSLSPVDPLAYSIKDDQLYFLINQATLHRWKKKEHSLIQRASKIWPKLSSKIGG